MIYYKDVPRTKIEEVVNDIIDGKYDICLPAEKVRGGALHMGGCMV